MIRSDQPDPSDDYWVADLSSSQPLVSDQAVGRLVRLGYITLAVASVDFLASNAMRIHPEHSTQILGLMAMVTTTLFVLGAAIRVWLIHPREDP